MNFTILRQLNNPSRYSIILVLLCMSVFLHAQIVTKPLFMQIKTPHLESYSGFQIDPYDNIYHINSANKDSIDISFLILVPKEMLSEKWAISLTPSIYSSSQNGILKDVVVKGWKFAELQEEGYEKYNNFMGSIIDSSSYEKQYIDQKRLEEEIEHWHDTYWQFYYDEWERQVEYEIWKSKQDGSIQTFSLKNQAIYNNQLLEQYLLRIENQSGRYLRANMDTTGLHTKYMKEFESHSAKMPRYFVNENIPLKKVPKKFKDIFESNRTLQDITDAMLELLVRRDSALMELPVLDYKRIVENEKRTILQADIEEDLIQLPKNENALLDTTIYNIHSDYRYLYTYRYPVAESGRDTIKVELKSKILAMDGSGFSSNSEDILIYVVNPLEYSKPTNSTQTITSVKKSEVAEEPKPQNIPKVLNKKNDFLDRLSDRMKQLDEAKNNELEQLVD